MKQSEYVNKIKEASEVELERMLMEEKSNLYKMRQQIALKQLDNPHAVSNAKKNVARIHTELKSRKIKAGKE